MGRVCGENEAEIDSIAQAVRIRGQMRKWIPKAHGVYEANRDYAEPEVKPGEAMPVTAALAATVSAATIALAQDVKAPTAPVATPTITTAAAITTPAAITTEPTEPPLTK